MGFIVIDVLVFLILIVRVSYRVLCSIGCRAFFLRRDHRIGAGLRPGNRIKPCFLVRDVAVAVAVALL